MIFVGPLKYSVSLHNFILSLSINIFDAVHGNECGHGTGSSKCAAKVAASEMTLAYLQEVGYVG